MRWIAHPRVALSLFIIVFLAAAVARVVAAPLSATQDMAQFWSFAQLFKEHGLDFYQYAGGTESMTRVPMGGLRYLPNPRFLAEDPETLLNMGLTAERLAARDQLPREDQDRFALASHRKAIARREGRRKDL